jgi:nucleoid-associated protein YgaU
MPDDDYGIKDQVATWATATDKLRDVAKWVATSFGALGAVMIGTAPLASLAKLKLAWTLLIPAGFGLFALGAIAFIVWQTTRLLTPSEATPKAIAKEPRFASFRDKIAAEPYAYLGTWAASVTGFVDRRDNEYRTLKDIDRKLVEYDLPPEERKAWEKASAQQSEMVSGLGQVMSRLLTYASFVDTHNSYKRMQPRLLVAFAALILGIVGFTTSVAYIPKAGVSAAHTAILVEPYAVRPGDTLSEIAEKFGVTLTALEAVNSQISDPNLIFTGQLVKIPSLLVSSSS